MPATERVGKAWLQRWYHARWADPLPIATVGNAIDWDEELPRFPQVRSFLEERLARLPPPFEPAFFRHLLDGPSDPRLPSPARLAARAAILARWL